MAVITSQKKWTILDLVTWGTSYLNEKGFDESRLTIELLISHLLKLQRIQLYTNFDKPLTEAELADFKGLIKRRLTHEPLQYIIGETEFMGLRFLIDKRALIPRPETEMLVDHLVSECNKRYEGKSVIRILDIGTGSGCIAVSLAKFLPNAAITAIDCSADAVDLAKTNADIHSVSGYIEFIQKDFLHGTIFDTQFDCIVSNPPYISTSEYAQLEPDVRDFEPMIALLDNSDGLTFFKKIAENGMSLLVEGGLVAVEHAYNQSADIRGIFESKGWGRIQVLKDFAGHDRFIISERGDR